MRTTDSPLVLTAVLAAVAALSLNAAPARAAGSGPVSTPSMPAAERTPEDLAKETYNDGVRLVKKADKAGASDKAADNYNKAQGKFQAALDLAPDMYQAWNYLGYTRRKLGDFAGALGAYDRALTLNPKYAEAIEYRGHAYLGLNRLDDAKQAYLALFADHRKLAAQLLDGMKSWVAARRAAPDGVDAQAIDDLSKWVDERSQLAMTTAALTREGSDASWR